MSYHGQSYGNRCAAPVEAYRAINAVHYAQMQHMRWGRMPRPLVSVMMRGYRVTPAALKSRFYIPTKSAKYAHMPRFGWIAWDRGQPVLMMVRYLCGGSSWTARGSNTSELPVCVKCRLAGVTEMEREQVASCLEKIAPLT